MRSMTTSIPGVYLFDPCVIADERGTFRETYRTSAFTELGITRPFCQENVSVSKKGVARGLHFQLRNPQAKLVTCLKGEIFDVVVDLRKESPDYGKWATFRLTEENEHQLYVPARFAHGFVALTEGAKIHYKCDQYWDQKSDGGIRMQDRNIGFPWGLDISEFLQAPKDLALRPLDSDWQIDFTFDQGS